MDAFGKLILLLYKFCPEGLASANGTKLNLISRVLDTVVRVLLRSYETRRYKFNQRPFYRLFAGLLADLQALAPDPDPAGAHLQLLMAFQNVLMILSPTRVPAFCFAWLELISHRFFMPKLLLSKSQTVLALLISHKRRYQMAHLNDTIFILFCEDRAGRCSNSYWWSCSNFWSHTW